MKTNRYACQDTPLNPYNLRRLIWILAMVLLFTACASTETFVPTAPTPEEGTLAETAIPKDAVLLREYWQLNYVPAGKVKDVSNMLYVPRGLAAGVDLLPSYPHSKVTLLDPGKFAGWDFLRTYHRDLANNTYAPTLDFLHLTLNRAATVGVIYYGVATDAPSWLSSWTLAGTIKADYLKKVYPVFTKVLPAGTHYLKPLGQKGLMYSVILAEANGTASQKPSVPSGLEQPEPNKTCPAWVHDQQVAKGPDGLMYRTWHPPVDTTYWCYFRHEHGSSPAYFKGDWKPLFNRYADIIGVSEEHEAFKVIVFENQTHSAMLTLHAGSSAKRRVCTRYHAFDIVYSEKATREIVGNFSYKGDFGKVQAQTGFGAIAPMAPLDCPENNSITATSGTRTIPVYPGTGYESWRVELGTAKALPFTGGGNFKLDEAITTCSNSKDSSGRYTCESLVTIPNRYGARHFFDLFGGFGMDTTKAGKTTGAFCTDYTGATLLSCSNTKAVKQYAKSGVKVQFATARAIVNDPWLGYYQFDTFVRTKLNIEDSLLAPN
jgi:hypothetical protein